MKLNQLPKTNPFNAPDGYFDKLPGIVQSRIEAEKPVRLPKVYVRFAFRYALPVLVLVAAGIFWFKAHTRPVQFETELAAINISDLEQYLDGTDINADELIENTAWSAKDLQELENTVYASYDLTDTDVRELLDVYDVESTKDSVQ